MLKAVQVAHPVGKEQVRLILAHCCFQIGEGVGNIRRIGLNVWHNVFPVLNFEPANSRAKR